MEKYAVGMLVSELFIQVEISLNVLFIPTFIFIQIFDNPYKRFFLTFQWYKFITISIDNQQQCKSYWGNLIKTGVFTLSWKNPGLGS